MIVTRAPEPIADRMIQADVTRQAWNWNGRVLEVLEDYDAAFRSGDLSVLDRTFLSYIAPASDIFRFELYRADGQIFWGTDPGEVGVVSDDAYFFEIVAKGHVFYELEKVPPIEIDGFDGTGADAGGMRDVAEIYTPVVSGGEFLGAIEFYTDVTETRATVVSNLRLLLAAVCIAGLVMFALTAGGLARSGTVQMRELKRRAAKEQELLTEQLRLSREVRLLGDLNEWLQSSRSLHELFEMVDRFLSHILPGAEGSIYVYSNSRDVLDGSVAWKGGQLKDHIRPEDCWGLRRGRTYSFGAGEVNFTCAHAAPHDGRPYYCFPIVAHGETVGLLHLMAMPDTKTEAFRKIQPLAQMCAEQISMAIANVRMRDELRDQSVRDPLTGLYNRRHMVERLRSFLKRAEHTGARLNAVSVDVDHFKRFNDNHGHDAGDMALRAVATAMGQFCVDEEVVCRMGGEEFMILVPDQAPQALAARLESLRAGIEAIRIRYGDGTLPAVTASFGVASYPAHGATAQDLIRSSDEALYEAKAQGRNCIVMKTTTGDRRAGAALEDAPDAEAQGRKDRRRTSDASEPESLAAE